MKITLFADVHGQTGTYQKFVRRLPEDHYSFQLGDMGIGFKGVGLHKMPARHKWIRGNHDNPAKCRENVNYAGDYGYWPEAELMWIAGAASIDRDTRIIGISWWPDEELSWEELDKVVAMFKEKKPRFVVSHECPAIANTVLLSGLNDRYFWAKRRLAETRTCGAMQLMVEAWQPEKWFFGHYHINKTFHIPNCRTEFRCIAPINTGSRYVLDTDSR